MPDDSRESIDALVTDRYLDMILAQADRRASTRGVGMTAPREIARTADGAIAPEGAGPSLAEAGPDRAIRNASAVLRATLLRAHPSFRFEERLSAELAALAAVSAPNGGALVAWRSGDVIPFPAAIAPPDDPLLAAVLAGQLDPSDQDEIDRATGVRSPARPLLVGGAITSAAISLVGVAWVAWRASHPAGSPMTRAARSVRARRIADITELAAGVPGGPV